MPNSPSTIERKISTVESRMTVQENDLDDLNKSLVDITASISTNIKYLKKRVDEIRAADPNTWPSARGSKRKTRNKRRARGSKRKTRNKRRARGSKRKTRNKRR